MAEAPDVEAAPQDAVQASLVSASVQLERGCAMDFLIGYGAAIVIAAVIAIIIGATS